jgi:hypothetical protein
VHHGGGGGPHICLLDPDKQFKGGDITWTGAQQFDASVDMTILHVDGSATFSGPVRFDGSVDFSVAAFGQRVDFSSIGVAGDATFAGAVQMDGTCTIAGQLTLTGAAAVFGAWASKDGTTVYQAETDGIVHAYVTATNIAKIQGYTDSDNPPATCRIQSANTYLYSGPNPGLIAGLTMAVKKGDYYEIDASGSTSPTLTVFWLPLGA